MQPPTAAQVSQEGPQPQVSQPADVAAEISSQSLDDYKATLKDVLKQNDALKQELGVLKMQRVHSKAHSAITGIIMFIILGAVVGFVVAMVMGKTEKDVNQSSSKE